MSTVTPLELEREKPTIACLTSLLEVLPHDPALQYAYSAMKSGTKGFKIITITRGTGEWLVYECRDTRKLRILEREYRNWYIRLGVPGAGLRKEKRIVMRALPDVQFTS